MSVTPKEALTRLQPALSGAENLSFEALILGTAPGQDLVLHRFNVADESHEDMVAGPQATLERLAALASDDLLEVRAFKAGMRADQHQIMIADPKDLGVKDLLDGLAQPGDVGLAADKKDIPWGEFRLEVRTFDCNGKRLVALRKATAATFLRTKKKLILRAGTLGPVKGPIITVENNFDAFYWDGLLFILRPGPLETLFELRQQLEEEAETLVASITNALPIEGADKLTEAAGRHWQMLRKLQRIWKQPYMATLTMNDVARVVKKRKLNIVIVGAGAERRISYNASDKWAILRLLDDDYLVSELTNRAYEVRDQAKHELPEGA